MARFVSWEDCSDYRAMHRFPTPLSFLAQVDLHWLCSHVDPKLLILLGLQECTTIHSIRGAEDQTQGLTHARQMLTQLSHIHGLHLFIPSKRLK